MEKDELNALIVKGVNIGKDVAGLVDIEALSKARSDYILWRDELQKYFTDMEVSDIYPLFETDKVVRTLVRGVGIDMEDQHAKALKESLEEEIKNKLVLLKNLYEKIFTQESDRLISKNSKGQYFYKGHLIELPSGNLYTDFFKIMFDHSDTIGFLSYSQLTKYLQARKHSITDSTFKNVLTNLFRHMKVRGGQIENEASDGQPILRPLKGKGFILNNPKI